MEGLQSDLLHFGFGGGEARLQALAEAMLAVFLESVQDLKGASE